MSRINLLNKIGIQLYKQGCKKGAEYYDEHCKKVDNGEVESFPQQARYCMNEVGKNYFFIASDVTKGDLDSIFCHGC